MTVYILWKYHILIHGQECFHITLGKCPEDEHIIFSVVLWDAHNSNTGTKVQDSFWETAANLFKTRHQLKVKNKQSIVIYQNKLHSYVLFYIWFFFCSIFIQFSETPKDILFVKKFILEDIFNFTMLFSGAYKIWKYKSFTKYSCFLKIIHHIQTPHKCLWISFWNIDQQEL